ncbi:MAG: ABC transporter permease [bacterium]|nr:ABC transporter permease [bacterium]
MTWWQTIRLVAKREILSRKRAFRISTGLLVGLVVVGLAALKMSGATEDAEINASDADEVLAMLGTIVLFGTIVGYGQMTLMGVAEEKSSRVVEVVLGCVEPIRLLAGKVIGIGVFALAQIAVVLGAATVMVLGFDAAPAPPATGKAFLIILGFFILGYAFYSTVYASFGALMGSTQNASNAAGPLNLVVSVGYMTAVISLGSGDNPFARILSLLPPFTPTLMPMRIVQGAAAPWEIAVAVTLLIAAIFWVTRVASRIYIGGVMRGGAKTSLRDAWKAASL